MATVTPVSFGLITPKYTPHNSKQQNTNTQFAATSKYSTDVVPNQKSALAVLLTSAMLCTVAIVNLIKAGR